MSQPHEQEIRGPYGLFHANRGLKVSLMLLLLTQATVTLFSSGVVRYLVLSQNEHSHSRIVVSARLGEIIHYGRMAQCCTGALVIILFCVWINRANKNGWMLDAPRMRTTPGASVAAFFIPPAVLWKPYGVMREIRSASYARDDSLAKTIALWWTFTVLSAVLLVTAALLYTVGQKEEYLLGCKIELVSAPLGALRDYLTLALVSAITGTQIRRSTFWLK